MYVLAKRSLPWVLLNRLYWSRSHLGCGLNWVQGTMLRGSTDYSRNRAYCMGIKLPIVQYSEYPACCWYFQPYSVGDSRDVTFCCHYCNSWCYSNAVLCVMSVHCVVGLLYQLRTVGVWYLAWAAANVLEEECFLRFTRWCCVCYRLTWRSTEWHCTWPESTTSTVIWFSSDSGTTVPTLSPSYRTASSVLILYWFIMHLPKL